MVMVPARRPQRASELIAQLREIVAEQEAIINVLKGALAGEGVTLPELGYAWAKGLTPQQTGVMGVLLRARAARPSAAWVDPWDIIPRMQGYKHDRDDVTIGTVRAAVMNIRKKLGADVIESKYGLGYRLSDVFYRSIKVDQCGA